MHRLEIIANKSLEEYIVEELRACECNHYTIIPEVYGRGNQDPKQGDEIWPEVNFIVLIYCDDEMKNKISVAMADIKKIYTTEGLHIFISQADHFKVD